MLPDAQRDMAFVYAFVAVFARHPTHAIHPFPDMQPDVSSRRDPPRAHLIHPQDLERAVATPESDLLDDLLGSFLSNVLNRKKPLQ